MNSAFLIGSHIQVAGQGMLLKAVEDTIKYGASTFMFYTGAPQNSVRKPTTSFLKEAAFEAMKTAGIDPKNVIVHAPYIINLGNSINPDTYNIAVSFLKEELRRVADLGFSTVVLHPGSHVKAGEDVGITQIIRGLNEVLEDDQTNVTIALETMAGKGSEIGYRFEHLAQIIAGVTKKERIGVCLDTCHIHDAGYDIIEHYEDVMNEFSNIIGFERLKVIHVNDSKNEIGAKKDRHENIGFGKIGFTTLMKFIYDDRFKAIPKILETPYIEECPPYQEEIRMIKEKEFNPNLKERVSSVLV